MREGLGKPLGRGRRLPCRATLPLIRQRRVFNNAVSRFKVREELGRRVGRRVGGKEEEREGGRAGDAARRVYKHQMGTWESHILATVGGKASKSGWLPGLQLEEDRTGGRMLVSAVSMYVCVFGSCAPPPLFFLVLFVGVLTSSPPHVKCLSSATRKEKIKGLPV